MKKSKPSKRVYLGKYIVWGGVLLAGLAAFLFWSVTSAKSDEVLIRERLHALAGDLCKSEQESTAAALLKAQNIAGAFDEPMTLAMDNYAAGSYDHERLLASVGRYRAMVGKAQVSAADIIVEIISKERAQVHFSGRFAGELKNGISNNIIKDIEAEFIKIDGRWLIKSMIFRNVLH